MSVLPCCCTCYKCFDQFTRSNTTDQTVAVGDCFDVIGTPTLSIVSNKLRISGTGGLLYKATGDSIVCNVDIDEPTISTGNGYEMHYVFGWLDSSNYHAWKVTTNNSGTGVNVYVSLIKVESGTTTVLEDEWFCSGATGPFNRVDIPTSSRGWFYDTETGYCAWACGSTTLLNWIQQCNYQLTSPTAGDRFGIYIVSSTVALDLDSAIINEPRTPNVSPCFGAAMYSRCNVATAFPPDEITLVLSGFGTNSCDGSGLNQTYILARQPDPNLSSLAYHDFTTPGGGLINKGGIFYRYSFSTPICNVHHLDFWLHEGFSGSRPMLFIVNGIGEDSYWFRFNPDSFLNCGSFDVTHEARQFNSFFPPTFGFASAAARVYV